jgi:hypothetical protein
LLPTRERFAAVWWQLQKHAVFLHAIHAVFNIRRLRINTPRSFAR